MTDKIVVFSSCCSAEEAERLARLLLETRVAACVSVLMQNRSFYWWKDKIENATEYLLIIKTRQQLFNRVRATLEQSHSYSVPEIIALPIVDGSPAYLAWLDSQVTDSGLQVMGE